MTGEIGNISPVSCWVRRFSPLVNGGAAVLDLAAGSGRHCRWFLERGCRVTAVDRRTDDLKALADAGSSQLEVIEADLEDGSPWPLGGRRFAAVVVVNYLWRPLFSRLLDALAPEGLLLYDTFAVGQEALGRPSCEDFLLRPGELLEVVQGRLQVLAYEHGRIDGSGGPAIRQRIAATAAKTPLLLPGG